MVAKRQAKLTSKSLFDLTVLYRLLFANDRQLVMKEEQQRFLQGLGRPQARLTVEQTAWALNCQTHDIRVLVASKLLKPLGNPPANGQKYFATTDILELAEDRPWLARATNALYQYWQKKNQDRPKNDGHQRPRLKAAA